MATLERIRQRSGLLITIIGLAMLAFILTDLMGSGNSILRGNATVVGKINGERIEINDFSRKMGEYQKRLAERAQQNPQQAPPNYTNKQVADGVWADILREKLMGDQYENLGIIVTADELYTRLKNDPSVQGAPLFQDQQTGQFNEALFQQYVTNLTENPDGNPEVAAAFEQWLDFEKGTRETSILTKYTTAIQKGLYMPQSMARMEYLLNNTTSTAQFVGLQYISIPDSTVEVSESDLKKYYNAHKEDFEAEETRAIEFVRFNVEPSQADHNAVIADLNALLRDTIMAGDTIAAFDKNENDSAFAVDYSDLGVVPVYYRKDNIPAPLDSTLMEKEVGYVEGPYLDGDFYRLTKVRDVATLPDSVNSRHVLISFAGATRSNETRSIQEAQVLADSLFDLLKNDTSQFDSIASKFSSDGSAQSGGDIGWSGYNQSLAKPYSDFIFENKVGDVQLIYTQFGFHIIEILEQGGGSKAVELITISRELVVSDETEKTIYGEASDFASSISNIEDFVIKAQEKGYSVRPVTNIAPFDEQLPGLSADREFVKWIYNEETKVGDIQIDNSTNYYVVAILTETQEKGYSSFENAEDKVRTEVIKEKKAEMLTEKFNNALNGASDINALATALDAQALNQVANLSGSTLTGNYGKEPEVIGAISSLGLNTLSEPIVGNSGVYVVYVSERSEATDLTDYTQEREKLESYIRPRVSNQVFQSLEDMATIKDRRAIFY